MKKLPSRSRPAKKGPEPVPATPPNTHLFTLENGLTLIVREDHSAPVVSVQAWCRTGSVDEGKWIGAGLSHVLEHMLFKGTTTRPGSRIDQEVQDAGGSMNAYTSFDRTVYYVNVPDTGARVAIDILADIMQNATLPALELGKELDVIRREMDMNQDDPSRRASRRLFETAFTRSPYRFTIIGYPEIFNELKPEDIVAYYRQRYVPNNMFFVVVGDIKPAEVLEQVRAAFKTSKAKSIPLVALPREPRQTAPRDVMEEAPIELSHYHFGWHIPDIRHPDLPALDLLAALLGTGRSSRLFRKIREEQGLVTAIDAWAYCPGDPGVLGISVVTDAQKLEESKSAVLAEVERIKSQPVPQRELNKVIKQFVASTLANLKTMQGQAQDLGGNWMATGDLNFSARYLAAAKKVTPAVLQRVAREYLTTENRTCYALVPEGTARKRTDAVAVFADQAIQKIEFPNGLCLLVKEDHRLPFVELRAVFKGGVLAESEKNNGLTQLMAKMLLQGTKTRSAEAIAAQIESGGGSIDSFGGNNSFGVVAELLSEDLDNGFELLADVLLHPSFQKGAFEREKRIQLETIQANRDHLLQSCNQLMRRALFGTTGYGLDSIGSESGVGGAKVEDVAAFHRELAIPNNCVLAVFGDVKVANVAAAAKKLLGKWKRGREVLPQLPAALSLSGIQRVADTRDKKQAVLILGFGGVSMKDHDRFALELLQEACSDLGSRLFLRIREKLGLAYYVGAQNFVGLAPGYFAFYTGTAPEKLELVEQQFLKEAELLRLEGLTEEELKRAKAKVVGQKKISRQDLGNHALNAALNELYGLGYDYTDREDQEYQAVTLADIQAVARKYLKPDALVISIIAPERSNGAGEPT